MSSLSSVQGQQYFKSFNLLHRLPNFNSYQSMGYTGGMVLILWLVPHPAIHLPKKRTQTSTHGLITLEPAGEARSIAVSLKHNAKRPAYAGANEYSLNVVFFNLLYWTQQVQPGHRRGPDGTECLNILSSLHPVVLIYCMTVAPTSVNMVHIWLDMFHIEMDLRTSTSTTYCMDLLKDSYVHLYQNDVTISSGSGFISSRRPVDWTEFTEHPNVKNGNWTSNLWITSPIP